MDVPNKCVAKSDNIRTILNYFILINSCIILSLIDWSFVIIYVIFWAFTYFVMTNRYLCPKCVYNLGMDLESTDEYIKEYSEIFINRMKIATPFLFTVMVLPIGLGIIYLFIVPALLISKFIRIFIEVALIALIFIQFTLIGLLFRRMLKNYPTKCLCNRFCPVAKKRLMI